MENEEIGHTLSRRINLPDIYRVVSWATGNNENRKRLWELVHSADRRTSANALWAMTYLPASDAGWVFSLQDELVDMLPSESETENALRIILPHIISVYVQNDSIARLDGRDPSEYIVLRKANKANHNRSN